MPEKKAPIKSKGASKTFLDRVIFSIRALREPQGTSRAGLAKYIKAEFGVDNKVALRKALQKGENTSVLVREGQRYQCTGDVTYERDPDTFVHIEDDKVGTGSAAEKGSEVIVAYRGTLDDGGVQFDAAKNFAFTLGAGEVIKGWDEGIVGMRVGGVRRLIVPPRLGYGKKGSGKAGQKGSIPPNATLRFLVTLRSIV